MENKRTNTKFAQKYAPIKKIPGRQVEMKTSGAFPSIPAFNQCQRIHAPGQCTHLIKMNGLLVDLPQLRNTFVDRKTNKIIKSMKDHVIKSLQIFQYGIYCWPHQKTGDLIKKDFQKIVPSKSCIRVSTGPV